MNNLHYVQLSACETALCGARARTPARPAMRRIACVLAFAVSFLLLTSCNTRAAFADGGGGGGHAFQTPRILQLWEGSELRVVGGLSSGFDAAALLIGYSISDTNSLTLDQRKLLSNPNTGGRFYELSTRFRSYASTGNPIGVAGVDVPNPGASVWAEVIDGFANFEYTPTTTWWCQAATSFVNGAKQDYDAVLGGQVGGSGGVQNDGNYVTMTANTRYVSNGYDIKNTSTGTTLSFVRSPWFPPTYVFRIPKTAYDRFSTNSYDYFIKWSPYSSESTMLNVSVYELPKGRYTLNYTNDVKGNRIVSSITVSSTFYYSDCYPNYTYDGTTMTLATLPISWRSRSASTISDLGYHQLVDLNNLAPTIPEDNNWPEDEPEPVPDPPVVPDPPSDPVTPQPPIDPINPQDPIVVGDNSTQVGGTDYTAYLQQIIDDLAAHCQHLQSMMVSVGAYLGQYIANLGDSIGSWFQWLAEYLGSEFRKTRQYLNELFDWLADQFSFESEPYNDSNMLYWLRQLYGQLGRGFGSRPLDPLQNTDYTGQWLDVYFDTTLDSLNADSSALSTRFTTALNRVITKFPVSIPWDVLSILNLLVASPVTPVVDVPMFTVGANGLESSTPLHIDLSSYDSAMAVVRYMFKLTFVVYCLMHTRDMMYFIGGLLGGSYD